MSSEIWVSNLISQVENRTVRQFLEEMLLDKYKFPASRKAAYESYLRQFAHHNYHSAEFPNTLGELKSLASSLEKFIQYRIRSGRPNARRSRKSSRRTTSTHPLVRRATC